MELQVNKMIEEEAGNYRHSLSTAIDAAAKRNGLTLQALAEHLGTSPRSLSNWRAGRAMPQKMEHVAALYLLSSGRMRIEGGEFVEGEADEKGGQSVPFLQEHSELSASVVRQVKMLSRPGKTLKDHLQEAKDAWPVMLELANEAIPGG